MKAKVLLPTSMQNSKVKEQEI